MNHKHQKTLQRLFAHPMDLKLRWKDIQSLFEALGAEVHETHSNRIKVIVGEMEETFPRPHKGTVSDRNEIVRLRHYLEAMGVSPD